MRLFRDKDIGEEEEGTVGSTCGFLLRTFIEDWSHEVVFLVLVFEGVS